MALGSIPSHASYFLAYEKLKVWFNYNNEELELASTLSIGATTTLVHDFFITPSDVVKQRLQICSGITARDCVRDIVKKEGLKGLYRSYPITVLMNIPFASSVVSINENLKTQLRPWERQNPLIWYFVCAGVSGAFAGVIINPLDVVKTRLQTQGASGQRYEGSLDAIRTIQAQEGSAAFLKGMGPRVLFHVPSMAICWSTYESIKFLLTS